MRSDLSPDEIHDRVAWLKGEARKGADRLHDAAIPIKRPKTTPAEDLARARARADRSSK